MSSIMDILLKKQEFSKVNIEECLIEWGEEKLSQDPKKYIWNSTLVFHENANMSYYADIVKGELHVQEFTSLTLEGDNLEEVDKLINSGKDIIYTNDLIFFINELFKHISTFCIIKIHNEEYIDEVYVVNEASEAVNKFMDSLKRNCPKGIAIIKNS
ncbi:MAG: hypothetical protein HDR28_03545 [Lachnospiraceae bacterium]|nr:hypothetical protein [Lachnospiraceae bacterium]